MKSIKSFFSILVFVLFFSLVFIACKETSDQGSSSGTPTPSPTLNAGAPVSFNFSLPSLIQQLNFGSESGRFTSDQILRGSLYIEYG